MNETHGMLFWGEGERERERESERERERERERISRHCLNEVRRFRRFVNIDICCLDV